MSTSTFKAGLGWYLDKIKDTELLSAEQERELARRIQADSDPIAREEMIQANLRLVVKIAKDYSNPSMTLGDLVAEGNIGLMRAVEEFNPDAGVRFSTYAAWWIKQAVRRAMINSGQAIRIPAYLAKLITKWRRAAEKLESELGRRPTVEEMAKSLKISRKKAEIVRQGFQAINAPTQVGGDDTSQAISEMIPADEQSLPEYALLQASNAPFLQSLMEHLEPREQRIIELRFALDGYDGPTRTYKEIGKIIGLTRERVRQLGKKALAELKEAAEETI